MVGEEPKLLPPRLDGSYLLALPTQRESPELDLGLTDPEGAGHILGPMDAMSRYVLVEACACEHDVYISYMLGG